MEGPVVRLPEAEELPGGQEAQSLPAKAQAQAQAEGEGVEVDASPAATGGPTTPTAGAGARPAAVMPAASKTAAGGGVPAARAGRALPAPVYYSLALACMAMGGLCLFAPWLTARALFLKSVVDPIDAQHTRLLQLNGGALMVAAAAAAAVLPTRAWGRLGSRGADLLRLALAGQGLANALTFLYYSSTLGPLMLLVEVATNGAVAALPGVDLVASKRHRGLLQELGRLLAPPRAGGSLLAGAHYLLAFLFPLSGVALFYAPKSALYHAFGYAYGSSTFLLAKLAGVADKALIPVANLLLKDAAEKGGLGTRAARLLNAGQLLAALVHMAVLLPMLSWKEAGWLLPVTTSTWAMSLGTSAASLVAGSWRAPLAVEAEAAGESQTAAVKEE